MAVKVTVPNKQFKGIRSGVMFLNGEAVFEDEAVGVELAKFAGYDYEKFEEVKAKATPKKPRTPRKPKKVEE